MSLLTRVKNMLTDRFAKRSAPEAPVAAPTEQDRAAVQLREIAEDLDKLDLSANGAYDPDAFESQLEAVIDVSVAPAAAYGEDAVDAMPAGEEMSAAYDRLAEGSGELYGIIPPRANDTDLPDGDRSFDEGSNWLEALQTSAVENGADIEHDLAIVDDENGNAPVKTAHADRPVADFGSGGRAGL